METKFTWSYFDYYYHDFEPDVLNTRNYLKNVSEPMTKRFTLGLLQALDGSPILNWHHA